jgi:hypothetical protein
LGKIQREREVRPKQQSSSVFEKEERVLVIRTTYPLKGKRILRSNFHQNPDEILVKLRVNTLDLVLYGFKVLLFLAFLENEKIQDQNYQKEDYADQNDQPAGLEVHAA